MSYICTYTPSYIYVLTLPAIYIYIYLYLHSQLSVLSSKVGAFSSTIVQTLQNLIKLYIFQIFLWDRLINPYRNVHCIVYTCTCNGDKLFAWYPILLVKILNYDFPKIIYNGLKGTKGIKKGQLRGPHGDQSLQLYIVQDRIVVQIFETQTTIIP